MATRCAGMGTCGAATLRSSRKRARNCRSPAAKPMRRPGRVEGLGSDWNSTAFAKSGRGGSRRAGVPCLDLGIAYVAEDQESVAPGETHQVREISELGDGALRVRGRGNEE